MSHFFLIEEKHISDLQKLFDHKSDGEYKILAQSRGFADIAQYCDKYGTIRIITVPADKLKKEKALE